MATDNSSDSPPESRRWRFASRKLPLAGESFRPGAAWWHSQARRQHAGRQAAAHVDFWNYPICI